MVGENYDVMEGENYIDEEEVLVEDSIDFDEDSKI